MTPAVRRVSKRRVPSEIAKEVDAEIYWKMKKGWPGLEIQHFEDRGPGIVATQPFAVNDYVVLYQGNLLKGREAKKLVTTSWETRGELTYLIEWKDKSKAQRLYRVELLQ